MCEFLSMTICCFLRLFRHFSIEVRTRRREVTFLLGFIVKIHRQGPPTKQGATRLCLASRPPPPIPGYLHQSSLTQLARYPFIS